MDPTAIYAAIALLGVGATLAAFFIGGRRGQTKERSLRENARETAEQMSKRIVDDAKRDAESVRKDAVLAGKEELIRLREEFEHEARRRREELERDEKRFQERETALDRKFDVLEQREKDLSRRGSDLGRKEKQIEEQQVDLDRMLGDERRRLEQLAGMSATEAKAELIRRVEDEAMADAANRLREIRESAKRNADREAKKIISLAVQRIAAEHTAEITNATVALPSDEMKGRIIGREGRNIRAFELATGVDVVIDDTPDTVVVSCFDPVRREVARLSLEKLVADGRIHPGRIEEVVAKSQKEVDASIVESGEQAA
jgi:ribonuclease Y